MTGEHNNLPVPTEKPSLLDYLDSFLPFRIPRLPFARTAANLDKAAARLILAKAEQQAVRIDAVTAKVKHRSNVEGRFLKLSEQIAEQALQRNEIPKEAALAYLEAETQIKFTNRAKVLEEAVKQLTYDPPQRDTDSTIDDDWLNMFARFAEDKTSEDLQSLFGKILAGEIREPGSVNLRTMTVVSTLTSAEANKIVEAFQYIFAQKLIASDELIHCGGPTVRSQNLLEEMGILMGTGGLFAVTYKVPSQGQMNLFGTKNGIGIKNLTELELSIQISGSFLTEAGQQLYKIAKIDETPLNYLRAIALAIAEERATIGAPGTTLAGKAEVVLLSKTDHSISVVETVLSGEKAN